MQKNKVAFKYSVDSSVAFSTGKKDDVSDLLDVFGGKPAFLKFRLVYDISNRHKGLEMIISLIG